MNGKRLCPRKAIGRTAASGPDSRAYAREAGNTDGKVNQLGNSDGIGTTTPVGSNLRGQSPYGIVDMVANACEWFSD